MRNLTLLIILSKISIIAQSQILGCEPAKFKFNNTEWSFPLTVQEAFKNHNLSYKPPGYYYKEDNDGSKIILGYHYYPLDFYDEYQPKEILFPRELHSYIFQIVEKEGTYDSLQKSLEQQFNKKFILTKGLKEPLETLKEEERPFEFNFLTVDSCLTVGIKRRSYHGKNIVTVRFMYGLVLGYMGIIMGSY